MTFQDLAAIVLSEHDHNIIVKSKDLLKYEKVVHNSYYSTEAR